MEGFGFARSLKLPFLIFIFILILNTGFSSESEDQNHKHSQKYPSSRTYKLKTNSSSSSTRKTHRHVEPEVPDSDSASMLSSRSLASPSSRDGMDAVEFDQVGEDSMDTPIGVGWGERYNRDSKSLHSLPTVAPRYAHDLSKYSTPPVMRGGGDGSSSNSGLGVYSNTYPYGAYSNQQSYYANPLLDTYPYYEKERERAARELLNARVNPLAQMVTSASSLFGGDTRGGDESLEDNLALGGHHHHNHHSSHHHGWGGWGWKGHKDHKTVYVEKYDNNALGLLGLLGVLSLLSNVLLLLTTTTTTTTTAAGRRKRSLPSLPSAYDESDDSKRQRIFLDVLPYLAPVAHVRNGQIPMDCALQGICLTNKLLVNEFGHPGRAAGDRITLAIVQLFEELKDGKQDKNKIVQAGRKGRNQRNCIKIYPKCKALQHKEPSQIPFIIGIDDVPKLLAKVRHVAANTPMQL